MILKDKQQKMQVELQVCKLKESLTSQLQLLLLTVWKKKKIKLLLFMIWEEEHLIFQFLKLVKELSKLKLQMVIQLVEDRMLMESFRSISLNNSKNKQALMSQKIKQQSKDSDKLLKKLKLNFLSPLKLKSTYLF